MLILCPFCWMSSHDQDTKGIVPGCQTKIRTTLHPCGGGQNLADTGFYI